MEAPPLPHEALLAALERINISDTAAAAIMAAAGLSNIQDLEELTLEELERTCYQNNRRGGNGAAGRQIPTIQVNYLKAMKHWVRTENAKGRVPDPADFTLEVAQKHRAILTANRSKDKTEVESPGELKGAKHWKMWLEQLDNYFSQQLGENGIPLSYVIRKQDAAEEPGTVYETFIEEMAALVILEGEGYNADNERVWIKLKELTLNGPAWNYAQPFERTKDGRGAFKAMRNHFEGPATINARLNEAMQTIETLTYRGESKHYTFESYVQKRLEAHRTVVDCGENSMLSPGYKVRALLNGIDVPTSSRMEAAMAHIKGTTDLLQDFDATVNYLKGAIDSITQSGKKPRNLSSLGREPGGRGNGRGGRGGGGRGNGGRGRHEGGSKRKERLFTGNYKRVDWLKLTDDEKTQIRAIRLEEKEKGKKRRTVAAASTGGTDAPQDQEEEEQAPADGSEAPQNRAGAEFGRRR